MIGGKFKISSFLLIDYSGNSHTRMGTLVGPMRCHLRGPLIGLLKGPLMGPLMVPLKGPQMATIVLLKIGFVKIYSLPRTPTLF
jgi:hypothetical protein